LLPITPLSEAISPSLAHLKDRMVQVQVTLVASPRNHLYRTSELIVNGPGNGAEFIGVLGQMDHPGDVADELDLESGRGGKAEDHLIDQ
jgi:hypothetical protein